MPLPFAVDFKNPDYRAVFAWRLERLKYIRENPQVVPILKTHYKNNPIDLIEDWGVTYDPRNAMRSGVPVLMPFILFPRQREFLEWMLERLREQRRGLSDKSRDMGLSWLCAAMAGALCVTHDNFVFGFGSRKVDLVDKSGNPDCLFYKVRMFLSHLPREFRGGFIEGNYKYDTFLRITIPDTGAVILGEGGDGIGRGGRATLYVVDEAAFIERPQKVEAALSQNTNCRIDVSSVNGTDNPFAENRFGGKISVFTFHWRDDPRKDDAWYAKICADNNPVTVAQEVDLDYSASKEGILIPAIWVNAAIDADIKLGIKPTGALSAALDVADEGQDTNAASFRKGIGMTYIEEWTGQGGSLYKTTMRMIQLCDSFGISEFEFDSDGMGVSIRGDSEAINDLPERARMGKVTAIPYRGSNSVVDPEKVVIIVPGASRESNQNKTNEDLFSNRKAQSWWHVRTLFENTYKAVVENLTVDLDEIISIPSNMPGRAKLLTELSQVLYSINTAGKIVIDKKPDGTKSPNLADSVVILYSPKEKKRRGMFG